MTPAFEEEIAGPSSGPVRRKERIASLDVLRGVAVFGILANNIEVFAGPDGISDGIPLELIGKAASHPGLDLIATVTQWLFVAGQMRALFSILFGAGAILLLERVTRKAGAERAADVFHRRNMWLLLIGLLHGSLIWYGDVTLQYSLAALLFLYPLRHLSARRLIAVGLAVSFTATTASRVVLHDPATIMHTAALQEAAAAARRDHRPLTETQREATNAAAAADKRALERSAVESVAGRRGYFQTEPENARNQLAFYTLLFSTGLIFEVVGFMITGMGLYKIGFLSARLSRSTYVTIAALGYAISIPLTLVGFRHAAMTDYSAASVTAWLALPYSFHQIPGVLATCSLVLLAVREGIMLRLQRGLATVGRMALSNYVGSSLICQTIFRWGPSPLYGRLEYYQYILVVVGVWAVQLIGSLLWLRVFEFGPLEWVWRSLTYWQRQELLPSRRALDPAE